MIVQRTDFLWLPESGRFEFKTSEIRSIVRNSNHCTNLKFIFSTDLLIVADNSGPGGMPGQLVCRDGQGQLQAVRQCTNERKCHGYCHGKKPRTCITRVPRKFFFIPISVTL